MGRTGQRWWVVLPAMCTLAVAALQAPAGAASLSVTIAHLAFSSAPTQAHVGDVIEFANDDFVAHTATARDGSFDVVIPPGKTGRVVLRHAGTTPFYCRFHPTMTGEIDVAP